MKKKIVSILLSLTILLYPLIASAITEVPPHEAAEAAIVSIVSTPTTHVAGNIQSVSVQISTTNVANGTSITATLMQNDGLNPVNGVAIASGTVNSNAASLTLSIPAGIGAGNYKIKASIDSLNRSSITDYTITPGAQPNISTVSASPTSHITGTQQVVAVSINTSNVSNTPAVDATVQLVDSNGNLVPGVSAATGTVVNNTVSASLTIPSTIAAGSYKLKATVAAVSNSNTAYTINSQSSTADINQVSLSSLRQNVGESKTINVIVNTQQIPDNTALTLSLVDAQGLAVQGVDTVSGTIVSNSATAQFTIPASSTVASYAICASVTVNSTTKTRLSSTFTIVQPDISVSSVSTAGASLVAGSISGNMIITGANFSTSSQNNHITLTNSTTLQQTTATPTSSAGTSITAAIPISLSAGTYSVTVTVNGKYATKGSAFEVTAPATTTPTGSAGTTAPIFIPPTTLPTETSATTTTTVTTTSAPTTVQESIKAIVQQESLIAKEANAVTAKNMVVALIKDTADDIKILASKGESTTAITDALQKAVDAAMSKVNTDTVVATRTGNNSKAVIDAAQTTKLIGKMSVVSSTAKELNSQLSGNKIDAKVQAVLNIKIETPKNVKASETQFPASFLKAAVSSKIDRISIDTGVATISIAPDSIKAASGTVQLSAAIVENKGLSDNIKKTVGSNPVFDFTVTAANKKLTSFSKPVEVTVPYTLKIGQNPEKITVYYLNDKGALENKAGFYNTVTKTVSFTTDHFSKYMIKENKVTFSDIKAGTPNRNYIEAVAAKGIMGASAGTKFNPNSYITRGELAQILVNAYKLGDVNDRTLKTTFKDVKAKDKYYGAIALVAKAGLMIGNKNGTFKPNDKISVQDTAAVLAKAEGTTAESILKVTNNAKGNITRADLAKILYIVLK